MVKCNLVDFNFCFMILITEKGSRGDDGNDPNTNNEKDETGNTNSADPMEYIIK